MAKKKTEGTVAKVAGAAKEAAAIAADATAQAAKATVGAVKEYVVEPVEKALGLGKSAKQTKPAASTKRAAKSLTTTVAKSMAKPGAKTPAKKGPGPAVARRNQNDKRAPQPKRPR